MVRKPVSGFDGFYEVSSEGHVVSLPRMITCRNGAVKAMKGRVLTPSVQRTGHLQVVLYKDGVGVTCKVHRLILEAFVGPCPEGHECLHFDGDPSNNRLDNLRWGTRAENIGDTVRHGRLPKGERHYNVKLSDAAVAKIRRLAVAGMKQRDIAVQYGVNPSTVSRLCAGLRRKTEVSCK